MATTGMPARHAGAVRRHWTAGVRAVLPPAPPGRATVALCLVAAVTAAAWLPFLRRPLTSDESGFWLLSQQLSHGSSLYGDYWVDRPPLLLWLFGLASHLGSVSVGDVGLVAPGIKLMGAAAAGLSVVLVGVLAGLAQRTGRDRPARWGRGVPVVVVASLLTSPLFGMPVVNGELLALPLVLAGLICVLAALREPDPRRAVLLAAIAGGAGAGAALVKQNVVDVFVFAAVTAAVHGRAMSWRRHVAPFAAGAAAAIAGAVALAAAQGTSPAALWQAVVVFRLRAFDVIEDSGSNASEDRLSRVAAAFLISGAAIVLLMAVAHVLRSGHRLRWPVLALVGWELFGVFAGGSYWFHYLTGLLPGLALLIAVTSPAWWGRGIGAAFFVYVASFNLTVWWHEATTPPRVISDAAVASYLRERAAPGDDVVVGFGHANIVAGSGLHCPYPQLWSLPVRVNDPRLEHLQQALAGPEAPRWVVVAGRSLASWGLDARAAQAYLEEHYVEQATYGRWRIWERRDRL